MPQSPAPFVWYELMTSDATAAEKFYKHGRRLEDPGHEPGRHEIHRPACRRRAGGRPDDLAQGSLRRRRQAGLDRLYRRRRRRRHRRPRDQGRRPDARAADRHSQCRPLRHGRRPAGHGVLPVQAAADDDTPRPADPAKPGIVGWHELYAVDGEKAFDFYADLFGWTKDEAMDMGAMGVYQLFAAGGPPIGGMMTKPRRRAGVVLELLLPGRRHRRRAWSASRRPAAASSTARWKCPAAAGSCRASIRRARCSPW